MTSYFKLLPKLGNLLLLSYLIFGFGQMVFAQEKRPICGFDHIHGKAMQENAEYKRIVEANEAAIQKYIQANKGGRTEGTVYKIPCVVHIIHTGGAIGTVYNPTDAVITTMISNMTKAFRNQAPYTSGVGTDVEIEFELAKRSPACTATTGINRVDGSGLANYVAGGVGTGGATDAAVKALSIWSNADYYNIWIVNKINGQDGTGMGSFTAGYAFFPGASADVDGTVMLATQTGSVETITHELGHALNLEHTFKGSTGVGNCPANGDCTVDGDKVCDTPPQDDNPFQCTTNVCGATTVLPNYMSYSNCATRDYTAGQSARMRAALEILRSGLISSQGLVASTGTVTAACTPTNTGLSSGIGVTLFKFNTINVSSGHSTADNTNYIDRSCLQQTTVVAGAVVPVQIATSVNASTAKVFIDYNNNGDFTDTGEEVFSGISTSTGVGVPPVFDISGNINIPATGITFNTALRMRVVGAGNTPATPTSCSVNSGQAEDYGIIITPAAITPTITLSPAALTAFTSCAGVVSVNQSYTVSGSNLTNDIVITSPNANFEISTSAGSGFTNTLTLTQAAGIVNATTIFVRQTTTATNGASGNITQTSTMATSQNKAIPVSVVTTPVTPTVSISPMTASVGSQTFTASTTNTGGGTINYDFRIGMTSQQSGASNTWNATGLVATNTVTCVITVTGGSCLTATTATSNTVTITAAPMQTITLLPNTSTPFMTVVGTPSGGFLYNLKGSNLTTDVTITAPSEFEISLTGVAPFFSTRTVPFATANGVSGQDITVRYNPAAAGTHTGDITHVSTGATTVNLALSGTSTAPCIIYVRTDGNDANNGFANTPAGAKLTIQAGINTVNDGCTLVVNAGTYNETLNVTGKGFTLQLVSLVYLNNLTIDNIGKTVTIAPTAGNLFINRLLDMKAGTLITANRVAINATATEQGMILNNGGTITGNMLVNRYLQANTGTTGLGYRFISAPTSNATFQQMIELSPVVNPAFNGAAFPGRVTPFPTLYGYNPALAGDPSKTFIISPTPEFDKGWVSPNALTDAMTAGRGYTINTSANQVVGIAGLLNNANVSVPVSMGNAASLGYNLVGNPYPSPISWATVLAASTGVNNAIYQNMATGQYTGSWASFVGGVGTNGATDTVAVMQGFFVIANAAGNVNFQNSARATSYKNPSSFRTEDDTNAKNASKNNGLLRLAITNSANKTDETVVYFTNKATANFDKEFDAVKFQLNGGNFPNIYTTNDKSLFSINALPNLTDDLVVPLTLQSWNGGVQKIAMTEKLNFVREVQVFLKDKSTNTLHDFAKGAFEFTATSGVIANRFELVFKPQFTQSELNGDNLNVYPNPSSEVLNISIGDDYKGELTLRLIDVTGREVLATKAEKTSKIYENSVNLSNLTSGTYILEVSGAKKMVKKVVKN